MMTLPTFLLGWSLLAGVAAAAAPNVDVLMYSQMARDARDRAFLAEIELGHAKLALERAKFIEAQNRRLLGSNAASAFESLTAVAVQLRAKFEVERQAAAIEQANTEAQAWSLRAKWADGAKESPKALAALFVKLRESHHAMSLALQTEVRPYAEAIAEKWNRTRQLGYAVVSADERQALELAALEATELVKIADQHVIESEKMLKQAKAQWAEAGE